MTVAFPTVPESFGLPILIPAELIPVAVTLILVLPSNTADASSPEM